MASNPLKQNEEKTQIIWLGTRQQLDKVTVNAEITQCHDSVFIRR